MLQRLSDYIADFLAEQNITQIFTVTGGGAMYLNDSFGHHPQLHCIYNHHEQASAIAAEAYARIDNRLAVVCVTTGPGATNAITGVIGKEPFVIDQNKCIKCNTCISSCKFGAINKH